jgi:hypothetical protein
MGTLTSGARCMTMPLLRTVVAVQRKVGGEKGPGQKHTYVGTESKVGYAFGLVDKTGASTSRESGRRSWLSLPSVLGPSVILYSLQNTLLLSSGE